MAFLGSVGSLVNNILGTTQAMKDQNSAQWDMWNAQNAYNMPAAQMKRLKEAGLNPMLVYGSGSHSFTAGSMSASGATGAGSGLASSLVSGFFSRLTQGEKNELAKQSLGLERQRISQAGLRLHQDLELGQAQIDQVRANTSLALEQVRKQNIENGILGALSKNSPSWLNPKGTDTFSNVVRALGSMYNAASDALSAPAVYDKRLPAIGANVRR